MTAHDAPPLFNRRLVLLRKSGRNDAQHVAALLQASNRFDKDTRFTVRSTGQTQEFDASLPSVQKAFEERRKGIMQEMDLPFLVSTSGTRPALVLSYLQEPATTRSSYARIEIEFSLAHPLTGARGTMPFDKLLRYVSTCVSGYGAATAAMHDSRILALVISTYVRRMSESMLPRREHKNITVSPMVERTPPSLVARLSNYQHPSTYDQTIVPSAVFWINYWSRNQIKAVGEDRVRSAPWAVVEEQPGGGLLLTTQTEEFDALNLRHLERIAAIADVLDLNAVQLKQARR